MRTLPHTHSCFVCGESNPAGLKLRFETDGRVVRARFIPRAEHVGFQQVIHGGIISTVLDEIMVWACAVGTKRFAFCVELNVRFVKSAQPGEETVASAKLRNGAGELLASAMGKYLPMRNVEATGMAADFVGDPRRVFEP